MKDHQCKDMEHAGLVRCRQEIQIAPVSQDPLYVKAFFSREEDWSGEYLRSTTAWD